jgi:signal transduction histidine kinase
MNAISVEQGSVNFSIEARLLRELGERLVRQPEVALVELVKNAYDADATQCTVILQNDLLTVADDGFGMTFDVFKSAWMRVGTSNKGRHDRTPLYGRPVTGEKGIGRFAARFLGTGLKLITVAYDPERQAYTQLSAVFDWPSFDEQSDLTNVEVPYTLEILDEDEDPGTRLEISRLRYKTASFDLRTIRSHSLGVVSPLRSLLHETSERRAGEQEESDPGFSLVIDGAGADDEDLAARVLAHYALRAVLTVNDGRISLRVLERDGGTLLDIDDKYDTSLVNLLADIRFFPRRSGLFTALGLDGRVAYSWVRQNSGVAVYDRGFRVSPYGNSGDDWLELQADAVRNRRDPRSTLAVKHFSMSDEQRTSTAENWMLRLPDSAQLIGVVQVVGQRSCDGSQDDQWRDDGLIAAADREGFIENSAFGSLVDIVRGAVEGLAFVDRQVQQRDEEQARARAAQELQQETARAIAEIEADQSIPAPAKRRFVESIAATAKQAQLQETAARERERQLETMSLLGVLAGFMTHEFGSAIAELEQAADLAATASDQNLSERLRRHVANLQQYVQYSTAYIRGSASGPAPQGFPVLPRVRQAIKVFKSYADDRGISVELGIRTDLIAPPVPAAFYSGVVLNLFSNALKAVTASTTESPTVALRAWNDGQFHYLEVSDNGIGIPNALRERVFDPLFTTTASRNDPLGSGMGLGLALVRRTVEVFGGKVSVVEPPPGFTTTFQVKLETK